MPHNSEVLKYLREQAQWIAFKIFILAPKKSKSVAESHQYDTAPAPFHWPSKDKMELLTHENTDFSLKILVKNK
jgi:hypothetical protein